MEKRLELAVDESSGGRMVEKGFHRLEDSEREEDIGKHRELVPWTASSYFSSPSGIIP